jgi:hypothetical protein
MICPLGRMPGGSQRLEVAMRRERVSTLGDAAAGLVVAAALALPFLPVPGDVAAHMKVNFRTETGEPSRVLSTETSSSLCAVMAAALSYEDPGTGAFTEVKCHTEAAASP